MEQVFRTVQGESGRFNFWCEGCQCAHGVWTDVPNSHTGAKWSFNGDLIKPTVNPSLLVTYKHPKGYSNDNPAPIGFDVPYETDICHSFIRDGIIQYLSDCTHNLAGQTIALKPF